MPKIIWKGIIKSEKDFPTADIPKNAKKLDSEENANKSTTFYDTICFTLLYMYVCKNIYCK